ncbi:DUF222 domain-containing protein [Mycobacterium hackensackense]|nr:DUF222 domain-containing protein [Mycobacterium hackensackense]
MRIALALRDRLPKVGALLEHGEISAKTAAAITWRTRLVTERRLNQQTLHENAKPPPF